MPPVTTPSTPPETSVPASPAAVPPVQGDAPAPAVPPPAPRPATTRVTIITSLGPILLELEKERAPVTTANFLKYIDQKKFDGATFYRTLRMQDGTYGLIQGGAGQDAKRLLPPIAHEPTTKTGLTHDDGAISMARLEPGSARGDFFIIVGGLKSLDANPAASGDNQGFAVFGHVVEGMDVVHRILDAPVSATKGEGVMKGQMIENPVKIISAKRSG